MRKPRIWYPGAIYHLYNQGVNRQRIYNSKHDPAFWVGLLENAVNKYDVKVFAFVTMQNHYHCLLQTMESNISDIMWFLGLQYSRYFNKENNRVGPLYRNRFQSQLIENISYLHSVLSYIHNNPVQAGILKSKYELSPEIMSSFYDIAGYTKDYPWISKKQLFSYLSISDTDIDDVICQPISREKFDILTEIEILNQKLFRIDGLKPPIR